MESIETLRKAVEEVASKATGKARKQPRRFVVQGQAADFISLIMSLPVDASGWGALQDQTTGELYSVSGASPLGDDPLGG